MNNVKSRCFVLVWSFNFIFINWKWVLYRYCFHLILNVTIICLDEFHLLCTGDATKVVKEVHMYVLRSKSKTRNELTQRQHISCAWRLLGTRFIYTLFGIYDAISKILVANEADMCFELYYRFQLYFIQEKALELSYKKKHWSSKNNDFKL